MVDPAATTRSGGPTAGATSHVRVRELLGQDLTDLEFEVACGDEHLDRRITHPRVQKPGLAFAGYYAYIKPGRVQIIGESENEYLKTLDLQERRARFDRIVDLPIPVFIVTKGISPFPALVARCRNRGVPLLTSTRLSWRVIKRVSFFLEDHLVPVTYKHAVLLEVYGLGVLIIGSSGVGKSEAGLDLVTRGHSLVADDRVTIRRYPNGELIGYSEGACKHLMELRGLGIINIKDLFGLAAIRERKTIDLVVELEPWQEGQLYDRLGLDESVYSILDTPVPYIRMPVATGRNIANLVEIATRNHVLKLQGHNSARTFVRTLEAELARKARE
ncbi:MAG: HPr(Ser) kinase/phosphatase [Acidobacteriota bacterium]